MRLRVRALWLRLMAVSITALWAATALALLLAYRPGGPIDPAVAVGPAIAMIAAGAAVAWPPVVRHRLAAKVLAGLAGLTILVLAPSLADLLASLHLAGTWSANSGGGTSAVAGGGEGTMLLPSWEAVYGWFVGLTGTAVFSGLGIARRLVLGRRAAQPLAAQPLAAPRGPGRAGPVSGAVMAAIILGASAGSSITVTLANRAGLRDQPGTLQAGYPGSLTVLPPCTRAARPGQSAHVAIDAALLVDQRVVRRATLSGLRLGRDEAWEGALGEWIAGGEPGALGQPGERGQSVEAGAAQSPASAVEHRYWVAVGDRAWVRTDPLDPVWRPIPAAPYPTLDTAVVQSILNGRARLAAEDRGIEELADGALARHCRLLVDGPTALATFPPLAWLAIPQDSPGDALIASWRGDLDWWMSAAGELLLASVRVGGPVPASWPVSGVQAVLQATLTTRASSTPELIRPPCGPLPQSPLPQSPLPQSPLPQSTSGPSTAGPDTRVSDTSAPGTPSR
jgi:hypothetical protein